MDKLFAMYDDDQDGLINYTDFASRLFGHQSSPSHGYKRSEKYLSNHHSAESAITLFKKKINSKGLKGMLSIHHLFCLSDDSNSGTLEQDEFNKIIKEYKLGLDQADIRELFLTFDLDRSGKIHYNEFMKTVRGEMNDFRKMLVMKAFDRLDVEGSGVVDLKDVKEMYNPSKHPAVVDGRKTDTLILQEFLESFELHHNLFAKGDSTVTIKEFQEYYNYASASIDNDEYFESMINNSWNLLPPTKKATPAITRPIEKSETSSISNAKEMYPEEIKKTRKQAIEASSPSSKAKVRELEGNEAPKYVDTKAKFGNINSMNLPKCQAIMIERFRTKLVARGVKGVFGMERQFKLASIEGLGKLTKDEFINAVKDFQLDMDERDLSNLFKMFDSENIGMISYKEFMETTVGKMSEIRRNMVERAFDKLDFDEEGVIDIEILKNTYKAGMDSDVKLGRKSEEEMANEFIQTFDAHHSNYENAENLVNKNEFVSYYTKVSAAIGNDSHFNTMITDTWGMGIQSNADHLPYAGVSSKIYEVDSKSIWKFDHHRPAQNAEESERITGARGGKSLYEMSEKAKSIASPSKPMSKRSSHQVEDSKTKE